MSCDDKIRPLDYYEAESFRNRGKIEAKNNRDALIVVLVMIAIVVLFVAIGAGWNPLNIYL